MNSEFNTPILFLVFNRPETTIKVFDRIKDIKPTRLFIACDGPRSNVPSDLEKCKEVKSIVERISWKCEVKYLFRTQNLGCKNAVISAIDWFFENVEEGIILEDDCLPEFSFFSFCEIMLEKYKNENRVKLISGTNYLYDNYKIDSFYFSHFAFIWGWATWKRVWVEYNKNLNQNNFVINNKVLLKRFKNPIIAEWIEDMIIHIKNNAINTWDIQLLYTVIKNDGVSIIPFKNQISNIGTVGTHTGKHDKKHIFFEMPTAPIKLDSFSFPLEITQSEKYDAFSSDFIIKNAPLTKKRSKYFIKLKAFLKQLAPQ